MAIAKATPRRSSPTFAVVSESQGSVSVGGEGLELCGRAWMAHLPGQTDQDPRPRPRRGRESGEAARGPAPSPPSRSRCPPKPAKTGRLRQARESTELRPRPTRQTPGRRSSCRGARTPGTTTQDLRSGLESEASRRSRTRPSPPSATCRRDCIPGDKGGQVRWTTASAGAGPRARSRVGPPFRVRGR